MRHLQVGLKEYSTRLIRDNIHLSVFYFLEYDIVIFTKYIANKLRDEFDTTWVIVVWSKQIWVDQVSVYRYKHNIIIYTIHNMISINLLSTKWIEMKIRPRKMKAQVITLCIIRQSIITKHITSHQETLHVSDQGQLNSTWKKKGYDANEY